jgi:hypothetical protein
MSEAFWRIWRSPDAKNLRTRVRREQRLNDMSTQKTLGASD